MLGRLIHLCSLVPPLRKVFWKQFYEYMTRNYKFDDWICMNLGYAPLNVGEQLELEPSELRDRYGIQLYHYVAGAVDLRGRKVLEVGSGRGGGAHYVMRRFGPEALVGVDFSSECVSMASQRYGRPGLSFCQGDAESLPLPDSAFDVVISIESTHCYANVAKFLAEVRRVLRPGGYFLLADFREAVDVETLKSQLGSSGMRLHRATDITSNVVRALELTSASKREFFQNLKPGHPFRRFEALAGIEGSAVCEARRLGKVIHLSFVLQKGESSR